MGGGAGVAPHAPDDHVGEEAFVGAAGHSGGLAGSGVQAVGEVVPGGALGAGLGDVHDVQDAVDGAVAAQVQAVT